MKKLFIIIALFASFLLSGCNDEPKGKDFIGHWYEEGNQTHPSDIKISYEDGIYHIDVNRYQTFKIKSDDPDYKINKLEAKAESDSVLSGHGPMFPYTMRLENGKLNVGNETYVKK
ncbi:TPA: hypothetical protein ACJG9G_004374 [Salmonella enterica subsp. enterica serovar Java]